MDSIICVAVEVGDARHHDAVGAAHDVEQRRLAHRLRALDLGDEERLAARGAHQLPRHVHVGAALGEGHRQVVGLDLGRGADVLHVLGGERGRGEPAALAVDALVVGEHAAVAHHGMHLLAAHAGDVQHDLAVVEQQHGAGHHVVGQLLVVQTDARAVAHLRGGVEYEALPLLQADLAFLELADADLGALQVAQDGDGATELARQFLHQRGARLVILRRAVREVEAHHVDARADHALEDGGIGRRRPEGRDDLGAAEHEPATLAEARHGL
jgi:hypothetical protein